MMDVHEQQAEFLRLLDAREPEQKYQAFLERYTRFIPREFVQNHGIGLNIVLRKLAFGSDYKSDFFYFAKSSDDWNAVFIELEKPYSKFFKDQTNEFHADFLRALQQINQWKGWLSAEENKAAFLSSVRAIQIPRVMARNPTYNKYVLVFGRRSEYENNETRRRLVGSIETPDFKVITFDSLAEGLLYKNDLFVGSRHNEFIDVLTDDLVDPSLFGWMEPTELRVSKKLHEKIKSAPPSHHHRFLGNTITEALAHAVDRVRIRPD